MSENNLLTGMPGGWTVESPVSEKNQKIFAEALTGLVGVVYKPIIVAFQVINGMNYMYIAKGTPVTKDLHEGIAKIHIVSSPAGTPLRLMDITPIIP